ncbi:MAG TPA: acyloxyacyl hydrolase, partial [Fimbriimonas sp.]|nr:acyloxyacyl hydrolase [Fimbriimonas sp.]
TSTNGKGQFPAETTLAWGALASVRYRWKFNPSINVFTDVGFGIQWINQTSADLRLANNTTPSVALGFEFYSSKKKAVLVGVRLLHASNAGRTQPNPGQNFLQYFVAIRH